MKDRVYFKNIILEKLKENKSYLSKELNRNKIKSFVLDDLLPKEDALEIYEKFPKSIDMKIKKSIREYKCIGYFKNNSILEEITYSFHDKEILKIVSEITGIKNLVADGHLYAGGLSRMEKNQYLNPHLDNSHDKDRNLYRVINLLFYVTPDRKLEDGGNLELWDDGLKNQQRTIHSKFNRLAVMVTDKESWHSVSKVNKGNRCCVSNYYFSNTPLTEQDYFHVTTFRGFPEQKIRNMILTIDSSLRMLVRKIFKKGVVENTHVYKK